MKKIKIDHIEFVGYEEDCFKFLFGFCGLLFSENRYKDLEELDGIYCDYGSIEISEVEL